MKSIFKKINCGCVANANIHRGFSYAVIQGIDGCGLCREEQKEEMINHLWMTETEKYVWEDLLRCYGWSSTNNHQKKIDNQNRMNPDITTHIEKMEREEQIDELWNRHCGEKIERTLSSNDID